MFIRRQIIFTFFLNFYCIMHIYQKIKFLLQRLYIVISVQDKHIENYHRSLNNSHFSCLVQLLILSFRTYAVNVSFKPTAVSAYLLKKQSNVLYIYVTLEFRTASNCDDSVMNTNVYRPT